MPGRPANSKAIPDPLRDVKLQPRARVLRGSVLLLPSHGRRLHDSDAGRDQKLPDFDVFVTAVVNCVGALRVTLDWVTLPPLGRSTRVPRVLEETFTVLE